MAGTNFQSDQPKSLDIETAWRSNTTFRTQIASDSSSFCDREPLAIAAKEAQLAKSLVTPLFGQIAERYFLSEMLHFCVA
jgi:hypothetical protein